MAKKPEEIRTQIIIKASPSKIWNILTDFDRYPEWNHFITSVKGKPVQNSKLSVHLVPPDSKGMKIGPKIKEVTANQKLTWLGHLFFPGIFDGEHIFELVDNQNGTTTFIHREKFNGFLVPFLKKMLENNVRRGFELMNRDLKTESEK